MDKTRKPLRALDDSAEASHPGLVTLSHERLRRFRPDWYGLAGFLANWRLRMKGGIPPRDVCEEHLEFGDSRAAVVVRLSPLLVAAYTDELDCIAMLQFPQELHQEFTLSEGSRLLTVNTYVTDSSYAQDLIPGSQAMGRYTNFHPLIAEFLTDDCQRTQQRKLEIDESEWHRAWQLANEFLELRPGVVRSGFPGRSHCPASI